MLKQQSQTVRSGAAYYALTIVTVLNFLNYIDRWILAAVAPRVKSELSLSDFQLGLLANAFLIAYFTTSPVFGALGDRISRTRLMAVGVAGWSVATAATGITRNFVQLLIARACVGIGEAAYATISPALLSDYFSAARRGRAFAVFYVAIPVGSAVGFLLGGILERIFGWRGAFYAVGLPGLLLALLALTVVDPSRGTADAAGIHRASERLRDTLRAFARNVTYVGTVLGYAAYTFALGGLGFWMATFLERVRGVELAEADFIVGSVTVAAGLSGTFLGGYAGDWLSKRMPHGHLWLSAISSLAAVLPTWLALTMPSPSAYLASFFIAELLLFLSTGPVNVVIVGVVPAGARALAMAVCIFAIHLLGDAISPPLIGRLADATNLARAVLIVPAAVALSGFVWSLTALIGPPPEHSTP
jgi:MFS family permease